ncbi:MAG: DUF5615 family PIN-like protein [Verrucomicrobia bacterium]|nr:DUF5615 family PIN-like protein [Verrucomicrobiota bacterium]
MRLLVDAQLPPALARWFVSKGHDAIHVFDIEFHRSSDLFWVCFDASSYQRGSRNPRPPAALAFCLRYSA